MKKMTKGLILVLCAAVLVAGSVMGTLAWLTAQDTITNTFTVGNISITLTETTGDTYKLVPGETVAKNPTVTVNAGSEECYLFVKVENGIKNLEATGTSSIAGQMAANDWLPLNGVEGVYYYKDAVDVSSNVPKVDGNVVLPLFANYTIRSDANQHDDYQKTDIKIVITAYALQATAVGETIDADKALAAWNANFGTNP